MNDIINIKEKFKVDDSHSKIRGFVCAYDENGNLVFTKENMIVESGRRFILNNGIKADSLKYVVLSENGVAASPSDTIETLNSSYKTKEEYLNTISFTKENFENISIDSNGTLSGLGDSIDLLEENYFSYKIDPNALLIRCLIVFNDRSDIAAQSLGIVAEYPDQYEKTTDTTKRDGVNYYTKSGDVYTLFSDPSFVSGADYYVKKQVLFSRVTFPTYYKSTSQRLTFKYYIYF